jgi:hypothetical protein
VIFTGIGVAVAVVVAISFAFIRALRRQSYRRWPKPLRWLFLAVVGVLVVLGGVTWAIHMIEVWGWSAGLWFLLAPAAYGASLGAKKL